MRPSGPGSHNPGMPYRPDPAHFKAAQFTIAAVSTLLGIPVPTIRSWEQRYGFPRPKRTEGRHRRYEQREIELLRALRDEITHGHPAREAVELVRNQAASSAERPPFVEAIVDAAMRLDPAGLRAALDGASMALGVDNAIASVALPAMAEMGRRWSTGGCDLDHERLGTEGTRAWLSRIISEAPTPTGERRIVLACGPKEMHTVGIEAFGALLARRGWPVRVLGPLTPTDSVLAAIRADEAVAAVITSQRGVTRRATVQTLREIARTGCQPFYAGHSFTAAASRRDVPGIYLGNDVLAAMDVFEGALGSVRPTDAAASSTVTRRRR